MMLFAATLRANPGIAEIRTRLRGDHDSYWEPRMERIWLAGPLLSDDGERIGQIMIVQAEDRDEAYSLISNDPYVANGCFESFDVKAFRASVREGQST